MNNDTPYLLALNRHPALGSKRLMQIKHTFKRWGKVWEASEKNLRQALSDDIVQAVLEARNKFNPGNEEHIAKEVGFNVVEYDDVDYPAKLREITDPPVLLYVKGSLECLKQTCVSVVGSRRATQYGYQVTDTIFRPIARYNITIVSGLALGIDTAAHKAAVEGGGKTVGVLGCGLDQIYPASNRQLAQKIIDTGGALISEFAPGLPSFRSNFPIRNRIIAALSNLTVVIEALQDSGALITAKAALEYNREVGAVPADINRPQGEGPNSLIKMGAIPITSSADVLEGLGLVAQDAEEQKAINLNSKEDAVYKLLSREPVHIDKIATLSQSDIAEINSVLVMLELKGLVKNLGGNQFIKR